MPPAFFLVQPFKATDHHHHEGSHHRRTKPGALIQPCLKPTLLKDVNHSALVLFKPGWAGFSITPVLLTHSMLQPPRQAQPYTRRYLDDVGQ